MPMDGSSFVGMPAARYRLLASAAGYLTRTYNGEPLIGYTPIAVPPGGAVTDLVIELHRGGTISGRVVDRAPSSPRHRRPIAGAHSR